MLVVLGGVVMNFDPAETTWINPDKSFAFGKVKACILFQILADYDENDVLRMCYDFN
ncbi:hypothetical protein [Chryseobacterium sp. R2A-55]|uniref:hypothetical protein n=1 Tax=Chryseobacterium sp. R2A-55 TaxID=2744445 RepID=UPI001F46DD04|nr:hypothetical protein [Chryseobacterium sp. R2A-55]